MARSHARLLASIWADDDFTALPPGPQRMYMFLISQQDLQHCGVIALRERRWSKKAAGLSVDDVRDDLEVLAARRFVVIDDDAEELLVRSLIRRDKVYAQPNVFKAAAEQIRAVSSPQIKAALLDELKRLPVAELRGDAKALHRDLIAELTKAVGTPSPTPPVTPSPTPSNPHLEDTEGGVGAAPSASVAATEAPEVAVPNAADVYAGRKPSRRGSATPSKGVPSEPRGKGSSYGEQVVVPLSPEPLAVPPSAGADAPPAPSEPTAANELIADWLESIPKRPPSQVIGQVGKLVKAMLAEGIDPADIRHGISTWQGKGLHPSVLPSVVNEVMNASPRGIVRELRPTGTDGRPTSGPRATGPITEEEIW